MNPQPVAITAESLTGVQRLDFLRTDQLLASTMDSSHWTASWPRATSSRPPKGKQQRVSIYGPRKL